MLRFLPHYAARLLLIALVAICTNDTFGQVIFNEGNAVTGDGGVPFLQAGRVYEGYDYGILTYSGNTNLPTAGVNPGNPFSPDLSSAAGIQTSFIDGFDTISNPRGMSRIRDNGGEWMELVVTNDHTDLRGYTFFWQDNFDGDGTFGELKSQDPTLADDERGAVKFSHDKAWANLRAGTIITITEQQFADEIRDDYPFGPEDTGVSDTGYDYDLSTNLSFDPFDGNDDWHINFWLDESVTLSATPTDTQYFLANSDLEVSNEQWAGKLLGPSNTVINDVRNAALALGQLDVTTDTITEFVGESASGVSPDFGNATGAGGVNNQEAITLLSNPDSGEVGAAYFEDVDWTTFGLPNLFNKRTDIGDTDGDGIIDGDIVAGQIVANGSLDESTLGQVQDFSGLYDPVRANTYDWNASGTADFAAASSWELANDNSVPGSGPAPVWSVRLMNDVGGDRVAQVSADTTVEFVTVMANAGTMALDVQNGTTLTVTGSTRAGFESPGRVLVMSGGIVEANGVIDATTVEAFAEGLVAGSGSITGNLFNSGGAIQPGSGTGGELSVQGDFVQDAMGTLLVDITGGGSGQFSVLDVMGTALLDGFLELNVGGPLASGSMLTIVTAAGGLTDLGLSLTGDTSGFTFSVVNGTDLVLAFTGTNPSCDFNGDSLCNITDIDLLYAELGGSNATFDLTGDGNVNGADIDEWLVQASAADPQGRTFVDGDIDLDGSVGGSDFTSVAANFGASPATWGQGNFDGDASVGGSDFTALASNFGQTSVTAIPEPSSSLPLALGMLIVAAGFARKRR